MYSICDLRQIFLFKTISFTHAYYINLLFIFDKGETAEHIMGDCIAVAQKRYHHLEQEHLELGVASPKKWNLLHKRETSED